MKSSNSRSRAEVGASGALESEPVRPGATGLLIGVEYSRVRESTWMYLTSSVTNRIAVELVDVQGNYPTTLE